MSANEVMRKVDSRYDGVSSIGEFTMVLIDRRDRQRTRNLRIYSKDFGEDSKALTLFETPADIRGTAYLNFDWDDAAADDDSWLYLPALQRVKRIASSDTSDSFMGSDFTFADINGYEIDWFDYTFVNESEIIDDSEVWVIEATPKPEYKDRAEEATGYSRMQTWIRKDNYVQVRGQVWELKGNRVKYFNSSEIELIDDIWTTKRLQAITTRNGRQEHASVLQINSIQYNVDVDDSVFTTDSMQRGLD
jgi:outer membrane lipoprotein-sorting protein